MKRGPVELKPTKHHSRAKHARVPPKQRTREYARAVAAVETVNPDAWGSHTLFIFTRGRNIWVSLKTLCEELGLNLHIEVKRARKANWCKFRYAIPTDEPVIALQSLPRWAGSLRYSDRQRDAIALARAIDREVNGDMTVERALAFSIAVDERVLVIDIDRTGVASCRWVRPDRVREQSFDELLAMQFAAVGLGSPLPSFNDLLHAQFVAVGLAMDDANRQSP